MKDTDIREQAKTDFDEYLDTIDNSYGHGYCLQNDIEQLAKELISTLPKIDRKKLRQEMDEMFVEVYDNPTTFNINEGIAKAQGYRERLGEMLILASREYNVRNSVMEMLTTSNTVVSKASSADKRKGEAMMKYPTQFIHLEAAEAFKDEVQAKLNNMKAVSDAVSRQASVLQLQMQLGEIHKDDETDRKLKSITGEAYAQGLIKNPMA